MVPIPHLLVASNVVPNAKKHNTNMLHLIDIYSKGGFFLVITLNATAPLPHLISPTGLPAKGSLTHGSARLGHAPISAGIT
jgi:hypothetical protein